MLRIHQVLDGYVCDGENGRLTLDLSAESSVPLPWAGARRLIAQLAEAVGREVMEKALLSRGGMLSLIFPDLLSRLTPEQRRTRAEQAASCPTLMFYPTLNSWPIAEALADAIVEVLVGRPALLASRNLRAVDAESLRLIRPLLRRTRMHEGIVFALGVARRFKPENPVARLADEAGVIEIRRLEALADECVNSDNHTSLIPPALPTAACEPTLADLRLAFDAYGFGYAFHLGERLAETASDENVRCEAHTWAALSAYQLRALRSGKELQAAMRRHALAAVATPMGDEGFPPLLCRLAIQEAGARNHEGACEFAGRAWAAAQALPGCQRRYASVWALNARAFVEFRAGDPERAATLIEQALDELKEQPEWDETPLLHRQLTRLFLCGNMTQLAEAAGDRTGAAVWLQRSEECLNDIPESLRPSFGGLASALALEGLENAAEELAKRLAVARAALSPEGEARYSYALGAVEYRRGNAKRSWEHFDRARKIQLLLAAPPEETLPATMNAGFAAMRAGRYEEAVARLAELTADPNALDGESQAEVSAVRAYCLAQLGTIQAAEHLANEAIRQGDDAAASADAKARIARWAHSALRDRASLSAAYELARLDEAVPATDRIGLLTALAAIGGLDLEMVQDVVTLAPTALAEDDANFWWDLPRLMESVVMAPWSQADREQFQEGLDTLWAAAAEREDCRHFLSSRQKSI